MAGNDILKAALVTLAEQHLKTLCDTVQHILSTHRAECVFAQIAEGIPTQEAAKYKLHDCDPQIKDRTEPGLEALDLVKNWRSEFHLEMLEVDEQVRFPRTIQTSISLSHLGTPSISRKPARDKKV